MDRLDAMAMLVAAVDEGSLAKAARKLGRSPASVTRAVALLEASAGERLLHRTTRSLKLTDVGIEQIAIYRQVLDRFAETDRLITNRAQNVLAGKLTVTAPEMFGRLKLLPVLDHFLNAHPGVITRVLLINRVLDMVEEGIDLAVRIARLQDSVLTAVRLGTTQRLVCASPEYLARAGMPKVPGDLAQHACIHLQVGVGYEPWSFRTKATASHRVRPIAVGSRLSVNNQAAALDMALRGNGICHPLSYQVAKEVADGRLIRLLRDYEAEPIPVSLLFHPSQRPGGIVRSFVERATPILRAELAQIGRIFT